MHLNWLFSFILIMIFSYGSIATAASDIEDMQESIERLESINDPQQNCDTDEEESAFEGGDPESIPNIRSYPPYSNTDPHCASGTGDPYEPRARIESGTDKGKCLHNGIDRSVRILNAEDAAKYGFSPGPDKIVIANFNHFGKFYVAEIPLDEIDDIMLNVVMFRKIAGVNIGHVHTRVKMKRPITFKMQHPNNGETFTTKELALSVQAVSSDGNTNDLKKGQDGSYSSAYGVYSLDSKIKNMNDRDYTVKQYSLNLNKDEKKDYVSKYFNKGDEHGLSRKYHSIVNHCGTAQIEIFDTLRTYNWRQRLYMNFPGARYGQINPAAIRNTLGARGFIKGNLPNLEDDPSVRTIINRYL